MGILAWERQTLSSCKLGPSRLFASRAGSSSLYQYTSSRVPVVDNLTFCAAIGTSCQVSRGVQRSRVGITPIRVQSFQNTRAHSCRWKTRPLEISPFWHFDTAHFSLVGVVCLFISPMLLWCIVTENLFVWWKTRHRYFPQAFSLALYLSLAHTHPYRQTDKYTMYLCVFFLQGSEGLTSLFLPHCYWVELPFLHLSAAGSGLQFANFRVLVCSSTSSKDNSNKPINFDFIYEPFARGTDRLLSNSKFSRFKMPPTLWHLFDFTVEKKVLWSWTFMKSLNFQVFRRGNLHDLPLDLEVVGACRLWNTWIVSTCTWLESVRAMLCLHESENALRGRSGKLQLNSRRGMSWALTCKCTTLQSKKKTFPRRTQRSNVIWMANVCLSWIRSQAFWVRMSILLVE